MKSSVRFRALMALLAVMLVGAAVTPEPAEAQCYMVTPQFCEYLSGGTCRSGCSPYCTGDVSGPVMYCWDLPQECCW